MNVIRSEGRHMVRYEHTQGGSLTMAALSAATLICAAAAAFATELTWVPLILVVVLGLCLLLFYSLTVVVDDQCVRIRFGRGPVGRHFLLSDIESCEPIRNHWYYGWGIRWIPGRSGGWLYNVSGLRAVELRMKNGRRYRIGTDQPQELADAIRKALAEYGMPNG